MACATPSAQTDVTWVTGLERPRYFARQLVTPAELNLESRYFIERMRRHNRMLHGWGVVCGAQVCRTPAAEGTDAQPWKVTIRPGYAIDGHGNELAITEDREVDLRASSATTAVSGDPAGVLTDPWCSDVWVERPAGPVWIAVCHRERLSRPVRRQPSGCGCDDLGCEYSRWQDGYEVRILDSCPASHAGPPPTLDDMWAGMTGPLSDCPPCPDDPCVVLARVEHDADGVIQRIDNCSCRRNVMSFAQFWWRCSGGSTAIKDVTLSPKGAVARGRTVKVTATGAEFGKQARVSLGDDIVIADQDVAADGATLTFTASVAKDAAPGPRSLTVMNPDGSTATFAKALTVAANATRKK